MHILKSLLFASLSCLDERFSLNNNHQHTSDVDNNNWGSLPATQVAISVPREFKSALSAIPVESIHSVLHKHLPQYKDGIFEKDHRAVEEVYKRSPDMANKLVAAARYDVLRRQNGNITTTARPAVVTTAAPVTLTSTNAQGSVVVSTFTPVGGVFTSQIIETSTLADGSKSTFTSFTVVAAPTQAVTSSGSPKLTGQATSVNVQGPVTLVGVLLAALTFAGCFL